MLRRIAWGFAGLLAAVVMGVPLWIQTHRADLPDAGDADLMAIGAAWSGPDGYDLLRQAGQKLDGLDDDESRVWLNDAHKGDAFDAERVADLVQRNRAALEALERGVAMPGRIPWETRIDIVEDDLMHVLFAVQLLVKVATLEAELLGRRGAHDAAFERALVGLRVGQGLSRYTGANLVVMMMGVACQGIAVTEIEALVRAMPPTASQAKALAAQIEALRIPKETWPGVWAAEYRLTKDTMRAALESDLPPASDSMPFGLRWVPEDYLFQPNRTQALFAARARERQRGSQLTCRAAYAADPRAASRNVRVFRALVGPNPVGGILNEIAMPNFDRFDLKRCHNESKLGLVQLAVALKAYAHAEGGLPERLDQLVPTYLEAIPVDAFDGAPLRYAKEGGVVYSIGDDFADAGGLETTDLAQSSEPSVRVAL